MNVDTDHPLETVAWINSYGGEAWYEPARSKHPECIVARTEQGLVEIGPVDDVAVTMLDVWLCPTVRGGEEVSAKPNMIDLFCCEGGASVGYAMAGFNVVGVDLTAQPRYPYRFHHADALDFLAKHGHKAQAIHASPPCRDHTSLRALWGLAGTGNLLIETLDALASFDVPWVVENVPGTEAFMPNPITLCGSMFGLGAQCKDGNWRELRRHRLFSSNVELTVPEHPAHHRLTVGVYGHGGGGAMNRGYKGDKQDSLAAMGIDWMSRKGVSQALPPVYTRYIGEQLLAAL